MLFNLTHSTRYVYETPVSYCLSEARLTPRSLPNQHVRETGISVDPAPAFLRHREDYFGNRVTVFGVFEQHERFVAAAKSVVDVLPEPVDGTPWESSLSWEETRELLAAAPDEECLKASEFIYDSPLVPTSPELAEYARKTFEPNRPLVDAVKELSHRIHEEFKYQSASTSIDMPLGEVLRQRQGVCQDFSHIMIGALRSLGLSARYISGYVRSGAKFTGAQASHAWASVFVPRGGWVSLDPTNDMIPSESHITLAWGRDYGDVAPVKGITLGGGRQTVEVEVYMRPIEGG